jgi:exosortase
MDWKKKIHHQWLLPLVQTARTTHGFIVLSGLLIGLCYFPAWFGYLFKRGLQGAVSWFIIVAMLSFIGIELWQKRQYLKRYVPATEDRTLGHSLIIAGIFAYPFCRFALWPQALVWLMILLGIVISTWGSTFLINHKLVMVFLCLSVYPRLGIISRTVWDFFFPTYALESAMAKWATLGLNRFGLESLADGRFIVFPQGKVVVGWGCNGLDMAITVAIAGLFIGLIFQQPIADIAKFMTTGIFMAFLANIPRLMLVSVAYVYWGEGWFKFWHGFWGGQVFSASLFTIYYYAVVFYVRSTQTSV